MKVNVRLEITGMKGGVIATHSLDDGETYVLEIEQERFEPFKVKISTPNGNEEYEIFAG